MAARKPKPKRKPARRAPAPRPVVTEHELDRLAATLRQACQQHERQDTLLQLDFIGAGAPCCVVRVAQSERTWLKVADGPWHEAYLQALVQRGLVEVDSRVRWGATLRALPALLAADATF